MIHADCSPAAASRRHSTGVRTDNAGKVTERWYSPELKVVVESKRTDPRNGEVLYRLVNVVRVEPAADLFQVPPDYTVVERARPSFRPPQQ